jgi:hypothetical protein
VIGAVCVLVPAFLLFPIPTTSVVRARAASALAALSDLLGAFAEGAPAGNLAALATVADHRCAEVRDAARPLTIVARLGGEPWAGRLADDVTACAAAAHALLAHDVPPDRAALGALRRRVGKLRRSLKRGPAAGRDGSG